VGAVGSILPFLRPYDVFDAATLMLLAEALEKAAASVNDGRTNMLIIRHALAASILELAARGERSVDVLCGEALAAWSCNSRHLPCSLNSNG
jgi:hypothetical protein